jgi:hypothetical protein
MLKTNAMIQSTLVRKHIPLTRWFNQETLSDMMKLHHTVFIKPDKGSGGHGIIRVRKTSENLFEVIMGTRRLLVPQKNLMQYIQNFTRPLDLIWFNRESNWPNTEAVPLTFGSTCRNLGIVG